MPITGVVPSLAGGCALAGRGQASAAPPRRAIKSRRLGWVSRSCANSLLSHSWSMILFRKPVSTFRDHALSHGDNEQAGKFQDDPAVGTGRIGAGDLIGVSGGERTAHRRIERREKRAQPRALEPF